MQEANPDAKFGDIAKLIGKAFKELTDEERKEYDDVAQADKERYKKEMEDYSLPSDLSDDAGKKRGKKKKDPNAPKGAMTAYFLFANEQRDKIKESNPDASFSEIGKLLGKAYKEISEEDKKRYGVMAAEDKQRAKRELAEYKKKKEEEKGEDSDDDNPDSNSDSD